SKSERPGCEVSLIMFWAFLRQRDLCSSSRERRSLRYAQEPTHIVRVSDVMLPHEDRAILSRRKRNILFPSGVKLCAQETAQQVVANHLSYFHLRGKITLSLLGWISCYRAVRKIILKAAGTYIVCSVLLF
uniref:Uncharacterized protein n=1 Tax=Monopterus albus TaxID=43700 RepID=A0A3Q3Q6G5_MONAL